MSDTDVKIAKLPAWAREHIARLQKAAEPNNDRVREAYQKLDACEARCVRLTSRNDAMIDVFQHAGRAGHETAAAYVAATIAEYDAG